MQKKYCIVPRCFNSTVKTPDKLFFYVPEDPKMRKKWMTAVKRVDLISPKTRAHCCEDHFDIENDMENYIKYKLVGGIRMKLKKDVVPHKFKCQEQPSEVNTRLVLQKSRKNKIHYDDLPTTSKNNIEEVFVVQSAPQEIIVNEDPLSLPQLNRPELPLNKTVCRICLAMDIHTIPITDSRLQAVYEKLSNSQLHTKDEKPVAACYMCYCRLKKCYNFMLMSIKAEDVLTEICESYKKITKKSLASIDRKALGLSGSMCISGVECVDSPSQTKVEIKIEMEEENYGNRNIDEVQYDYSQEQSDNEDKPDTQDMKTSANEDERHDEGSFQDMATSDNDDEKYYEVPLQDLATLVHNDKEYDKIQIENVANEPDAKLEVPLEDIAPTDKNDKKRVLNRGNKRKSDVKVQLVDIKFQKLDDGAETHNQNSEQLPEDDSTRTQLFTTSGTPMSQTNKNHYQCTVCNRSYSTEYRLKMHAPIHTGEKRFQCHVCGSTFTNNSQLYYHFKKHPFCRPSSFQSDIKKDYKQFQCRFCAKCLCNETSLEKHLRAHTEKSQRALIARLKKRSELRKQKKTM